MDHDQNFKNLVLDYPREALAFCAEAEARAITPDVRITPVREEQLKERLGERFRELDVPLLVEWPDGQRAALVFVVEEETDPARFSAPRLAHYCLDIAELLKTRRVVPVVIFLHGGPNERRLQLGSEHTSYLDFHFIAVDLAAMPYSRWRDSDNIVARINLPNMRHEQHERVEVFAAAIKGLITREQDPEKRLKYTDFIDSYAALDDNERARYQQDYPDEVENMRTFSERVREEGMQQGMRQGMQQGMQQGEAILLLQLMHHKFGDIPDDIRHRVESAEPETLTRWFGQALTADNLDEVLHGGCGR